MANLTKEDVTEIVEKTVDRVMLRMGIDTSDPIEVQEDHRWVRNARKGSENVKSKALMTVVGSVFTGICFLIYKGFKAMGGFG